MRYKDSIIFLHTKLFRLFFKKNQEKGMLAYSDTLKVPYFTRFLPL